MLMENKQQVTYTAVFAALRNVMPVEKKDGPTNFSVDFELAASNAFKVIFPTATEAFCYFHFSQSLWRRLQQSGHSAEYRQEANIDLRVQFHAVLSICFVPSQDVPEALALLQESCEDELDEVLDLLADYYVMGRRRGRGHRAPRYPIPT